MQEAELLQFFQELMRTSDTVIIITDKGGRVQFWSSMARQLFDLVEDDVQGRSIAELAGHFPDRVSLLSPLQEAMERSIREGRQIFLPDLAIRFQSGGLRYAGMNVVPIFLKQERHIGFLVNGKDITHTLESRKEEEENLKFRALGELAAGIIHEINTPVQFIQNNLQYLSACLESAGPGEPAGTDAHGCDEMGDVIRQSLEGLEQITGMIRSLRNYVHPGKDTPQRFSILQAVEDAVRLSTNQWKHHSRLHVDYPGEETLWVRGYPAALSRAVVNMIINAAHAIEERFGNSGVEKGEIRLSLEADTRRVVLSISDNGIGMDEEVKSRIFEPFFTTKRVGRGTGQGLALVYSTIVVKLKGTIKADSVPGEGSCFVITLPRDPGPDHDTGL